MLQYRVCLAPLRYGAGLKGKIVDAWWHGLPVCTTTIGSEGMTTLTRTLPTSTPTSTADDTSSTRGNIHGTSSNNNTSPSSRQWGGLDGGMNAEEIAEEAALLYSDSQLWEESQSRGFDLLKELYNAKYHFDTIHGAIEKAKEEMKSRRSRGYVGQMLWQQQLRATEYFSRWIELKEKDKREREGQI